MKLNAKAFGLTGGILWGVSLFFWTLIATSNGFGEQFLTDVVGLYPGYDVSTAGAFIGLIWGFFDAGIGLLIFAWLYNWLGTKVK